MRAQRELAYSWDTENQTLKIGAGSSKYVPTSAEEGGDEDSSTGALDSKDLDISDDNEEEWLMRT